MSRFTEQQLDQARNAVSISSLVGKRVNLRKAGDEYSAPCPIHNGKKQNFTVNDKKGFYHCFSCGAHGDAIKWLTDVEGYAFHDAVSYLLGGDPRPGERRIEQRQSVRQDDEPKVVDPLLVAEHIRSLAQPIRGTLVERYLTGAKRQINLDAIEGYTDVLGFVPKCPMASWRVGKSHRDVPHGPAMIAPFHFVERVRSMIYNDDIIRTEYRGIHVTYLNGDGSDKVSGYWPSGEKIIQRKFYGKPNGCAILFTPMGAPKHAPLLNGEGVENTLSALSSIKRSTPVLRVAASLSLFNHQGYAIQDDEGAIPLFDVRYQRGRNVFGFDNPGDVISVIDADMSPQKIKVRRHPNEMMSMGITTQERTKLCDELITQKWRLHRASSHTTITPPDGMDFNDHWRHVNATA